jgi:hypothetical protein
VVVLAEIKYCFIIICCVVRVVLGVWLARTVGELIYKKKINTPGLKESAGIDLAHRVHVTKRMDGEGWPAACSEESPFYANMPARPRPGVLATRLAYGLYILPGIILTGPAPCG